MTLLRNPAFAGSKEATKTGSCIPAWILRKTTELLRDIQHAYREHERRRMDRIAFQHLLGLDDRMLSDIGVRREDVIWASLLPLSENASMELEKIARSR